MVGHRRVGSHVNGKDIGELLDAISNSASMVLEALAVVLIVPA